MFVSMLSALDRMLAFLILRRFNLVGVAWALLVGSCLEILGKFKGLNHMLFACELRKMN